MVHVDIFVVSLRKEAKKGITLHINTLSSAMPVDILCREMYISRNRLPAGYGFLKSFKYDVQKSSKETN